MNRYDVTLPSGTYVAKGDSRNMHAFMDSVDNYCARQSQDDEVTLSFTSDLAVGNIKLQLHNIFSSYGFKAYDNEDNTTTYLYAKYIR